MGCSFLIGRRGNTAQHVSPSLDTSHNTRPCLLPVGLTELESEAISSDSIGRCKGKLPPPSVFHQVKGIDLLRVHLLSRLSLILVSIFPISSNFFFNFGQSLNFARLQ